MISNLQPFRRRCVVRYHSENVRFQYKPVLTIFYCCIPYSFILPYFKPAVNYPNMQNIFKNLSRKIYTFTQKNEQTEVHSSKILFSLFQRRFKPSHDNISRLNSVLLVTFIIVLLSGSMVVSQSCSGSISPRPLYL